MAAKALSKSISPSALKIVAFVQPVMSGNRAGGAGPVAPVLAGPLFNSNGVNYLVYLLNFTFARCTLHFNEILLQLYIA